LKHVENETIFWIEENEIETTETIVDKEWNVKFNKVKKVQQKNRIKGIFPYEFVDSFDKLDYKNIYRSKIFPVFESLELDSKCRYSKIHGTLLKNRCSCISRCSRII
jgi:hypothetical protein